MENVQEPHIISLGIHLENKFITASYTDDQKIVSLEFGNRSPYLNSTISFRRKIRIGEIFNQEGVQSGFLKKIIVNPSVDEETTEFIYGKEYKVTIDCKLSLILRQCKITSEKFGRIGKTVIAVPNEANIIVRERIKGCAEMIGLREVEVIQKKIMPFAYLENFDEKITELRNKVTNHLVVQPTKKCIKIYHGICNRTEEERKVEIVDSITIDVGIIFLMSKLYLLICEKLGTQVGSEKKSTANAIFTKLYRLLFRDFENYIFEDEEKSFSIKISKNEIGQVLEKEIIKIREGLEELIGRFYSKGVIELIGKYGKFRIIEELVEEVAKKRMGRKIKKKSGRLFFVSRSDNCENGSERRK